jgi:arylsulfatase A-like enzyme
MRYPKEIKPGQVSNDIVLNLDFAPTFLDYAGAQIPNEMQGESLRALARSGQPENWRKAMYYHYYEYPHGWHFVKRHYGVRTDQYKLIHFYEDIDEWEFYDLKVDPNEINNIFGNPAYAEIIENSRQQLLELRQEVGDTNSVMTK